MAKATADAMKLVGAHLGPRPEVGATGVGAGAPGKSSADEPGDPVITFLKDASERAAAPSGRG